VKGLAGRGLPLVSRGLALSLEREHVSGIRAAGAGPELALAPACLPIPALRYPSRLRTALDVCARRAARVRAGP